jgi:putative membrane protein
MGSLLLRWIILALALIASSYVVGIFMPDEFVVEYQGLDQVLTLMIGTAVLAFVNTFIGGILKLILLPLNCLTLGLASLFVNAGLLLWVGGMGLGFKVTDFWAAFAGSIIVSAVNGMMAGLLVDEDEED